MSTILNMKLITGCNQKSIHVLISIFCRKYAISMRNDLEGKNTVRMVPRGGIEPPTQGFSVLCSTN